jgi:hypothetical protein
MMTGLRSIVEVEVRRLENKHYCNTYSSDNPVSILDSAAMYTVSFGSLSKVHRELHWMDEW